MPTFVVSHRSPLVALLVAVSLKLYYRQRNVRIVVAEIFTKNASGLAEVRPWCGTSALSFRHVRHWDFLSSLISSLLVSVLVYAANIRIVNGRPVSPEIPSQRCLEVSLGSPSHHLAFLYHPSMVESLLRHHLSQLPSVLFVSVANKDRTAQLVQYLRTSADQVVWVHFESLFSNLNPFDADLVASSNICSTRYFPLHEPSHLPPHVLWIPQCRSVANISSKVSFSTHVHSLGNSSVRLSVLSNGAVSEDDFSGRYDLMYAFAACGHVLDSVDGIMGKYKLNVTPHRL